MSDADQTIVSLEVTYDESSEPAEIQYFHNVFGLMKFEVDGETAILDPKWNRLGDRDLSDGFERWVTTGDVIRSVLALPFIEDVDASRVRYRNDSDSCDTATDIP